MSAAQLLGLKEDDPLSDCGGHARAFKPPRSVRPRTRRCSSLSARSRERTWIAGIDARRGRYVSPVRRFAGSSDFSGV